MIVVYYSNTKNSIRAVHTAPLFFAPRYRVLFQGLQILYVIPESVKFMIFDNQLAYCKLV